LIKLASGPGEGSRGKKLVSPDLEKGVGGILQHMQSLKKLEEVSVLSFD
jgi:hypothetical protein